MKQLVLASRSLARQTLLQQFGYAVSAIDAADIDETPKQHEKVAAYVARLAIEKATAVATRHPGSIILAADTVAATGQRIFGKPADHTAAEAMLRRYSGRRHQCLTAVAVTDGEHVRHRVCITTLKVKRLDDAEIEFLLSLDDWKVASGGYKSQGPFALMVEWMHGSPSGVVGLPAFETYCLLKSFGIMPKPPTST